ncbi:unnamed protein product [Paramecium sonneborni]|uniref:DUF4378 domain-containing protein n=1 Tax=Paramecium sonneborni TaxID=65129 RepID=A0A8S1KDY6_9CILI|nr:unnamed protein product [Paramecium sonneborni]
MNTYSSVKSFDSQIQGRRMQEPNIAVMHQRHQQSPKYHSPESNLDNFVNLKAFEQPKILKKKKLTQGQQGKPKVQIQQIKKPAQQSMSVKKQTKRVISPKKKKAHTVDSKQQMKVIKPSQQQRREELGLGQLNEKQIKQRIKKIKSKTKIVEPQLKKKIYQPNYEIQHYMVQKKTIDNTNSIQKQMITLLDKQRKLENLAKLNESVKEIFKKCKTLENSQPQTPKVNIKKKKYEIPIDIQLKKQQSQDIKKCKEDKINQESKKQKNQEQIKLKKQYEDLNHRYQQLTNPETNLDSNNQYIEEIDDEDQEDQYSQNSKNQFTEMIVDTLSKIPPTQFLIDKIRERLEQQNDLDPNELTGQDYLVFLYHFMNEAATKLQSVWRGYSIRMQLLNELQEMLEQQQNDSKNQDEEQEEHLRYKQPPLVLKQEQKNGQQKHQIQEINQQQKMPKSILNIIAQDGIVSNQTKQQQQQQQQQQKELQQKLYQQQQFEDQQQKQSQQQQLKDIPFQNKNRYDKNFSDQTDDLVIIQQPNSPANQEIYFYNPFGQNFKQSLEKQIHYSNIKSSIVSEEDQKSALSQSVIQQIQQELELWNSQIENIIKQDPEKQAFANVKQQMSQTILNIVSQHMRKQKEIKTHERKDSEQSVDMRIRSQLEANNEKTFNDARKRLQKTHEQSVEHLQLSSKENDVNRSSLMSLQSQLMRKETELLNMREEAIHLRYKAELKKIKDNQIKKLELENWLEKEKEDLKNTKQAIEISRKREAKAIQKIQRDLQIVQTFDENNPKLQSLKKQVDEQLCQSSTIKSQKQIGSDIMIINHFDVEQHDDLDEMPETYSEDLQNDNLDSRNLLRQNIIESDKQIETYQTLSAITNDILDEIVQNLTEELLVNKDHFEFIISNLISQSVIPQLPISIKDIKTYIKQLFQYILENHIEELIQNLNIPYGFTPFKRMQLIHGYDNDDEEIEDEFHQNEEDIQIAFPLDEKLFQEFESYRLQLENEPNDNVQFGMKELEHIHNKAVFDACNEALNYERPNFTNSGLPYPWQNKSNQLIIEKKDLENILKNMESKVINWSRTLGGFLPIEDDSQTPEEKQEILDEKNQQMMIQQLNQLENPLLFDSQLSQQMFDNIAQIRDERLYKMLIQDIKESEFRWYLIEDDRTEFLMELGDIIFEQLVEEMASEQHQL